MFCTSCGTQLSENVAFCPNCGAPVELSASPEVVNQETDEVVNQETDEVVSPKSRTAALILSITLGSYGINRFYLGASGGGSRLTFYILGMVFYFIGLYLWPFLLVSLPFLIICSVGHIKDIIHAAKGTMVDGLGLPVKKW